jgi:predicted DNA-binding transcriptional regulator AlpA
MKVTMIEPAANAKLLYNVNDLQDILGIGQTKAYELMKNPAFPSCKIGKTYHIYSVELQKWLASLKGREFLL